MGSTSVSASLAALFTVTSTCGNRLRSIMDILKYSSVPDEILALSNEINDLRAVLAEVEASHQVINRATIVTGQPAYTITYTAEQLEGARLKMVELDKLISSSVKLNQHNTRMFRKAFWLRSRKMSMAMIRELREIKQNIMLIMASKAVTEIHRVRLSIRRLNIPRSIPLEIQSELEGLDGRGIHVSHSDLADPPVPLSISNPELLPSRSELPAMSVSAELSNELSSRLGPPVLVTSLEASSQAASYSAPPAESTSFERLGRGQSDLRLRDPPKSPNSLDHVSSWSKRPVTTRHHEPFNTDNASVPTFADPVELGTAEHQIQAACQTWGFDWTAFQSASQEPAIPVSFPVSDPLDLGRDSTFQVPRTIPRPIELGNETQRLQTSQEIWTPDRVACQPPSQPVASDQYLSSSVPECNSDMLGELEIPEIIRYPILEDRRPARSALRYSRPALTSRLQQSQSSIFTFECEKLISCDRRCLCICHSTYRYKSPGMVRKLIGSLLFGYTGLPVLAPKCDMESCVNQVFRSIRATYTFPAWFLMKTLNLIAENSSKYGPSFGLSVRNRIEVGAGISILSLARQGNIPGIIKLLENHKASLTDVDSKTGESCFEYALQKLQIETCHFLLDIGVNPHLPGQYGSTPIQRLCYRMLTSRNRGSSQCEYNSLIYRVADSPSDILEFSNIHNVAAGLTQVELGSILNDRTSKCELNSKDCYGMTPLHWAASCGNIPALKALLRVRVDVDMGDIWGSTALHEASRSGNLRCVELLLIAGSDVHAKDQYGFQALLYAATFPSNSEVLDTLLVAGADVHYRDVWGTSALHVACASNQIDNARVLLAAGARINEQDHDGDTPLLDSICYDREASIKFLLCHGANIEHQNQFGHTVLHRLAQRGSLSTIAPFMSCQLGNLDTEKRNKAGRTAWEELPERPAVPEGFVEAFEALLARCRAQRSASVDAEVAEMEG